MDEAKKARLIAVANANLAKRPTPFHGISEGEVFLLLGEVQQYRIQMQRLQEALAVMGKNLERAQNDISQLNAVQLAMTDIIVAKGIMTADEVANLIGEKQWALDGLTDKENGVVESGDTVGLKGGVYYGDEPVEVFQKLMAHQVGLGYFLDEHLLGLSKGAYVEIDHMESETEPRYGKYAGKMLQWKLTIKEVKTPVQSKSDSIPSSSSPKNSDRLET